MRFYFHYRGSVLRDCDSAACALFTELLLVFLLQLADCCTQQQTLLAVFWAAVLKMVANWWLKDVGSLSARAYEQVAESLFCFGGGCLLFLQFLLS